MFRLPSPKRCARRSVQQPWESARGLHELSRSGSLERRQFRSRQNPIRAEHCASQDRVCEMSQGTERSKWQDSSCISGYPNRLREMPLGHILKGNSGNSMPTTTAPPATTMLQQPWAPCLAFFACSPYSRRRVCFCFCLPTDPPFLSGAPRKPGWVGPTPCPARQRDLIHQGQMTQVVCLRHEIDQEGSC